VCKVSQETGKVLLALFEERIPALANPQHSQTLRTIRWLAVGLIVVLSLFLAANMFFKETPDRAAIGGDFTLIDQDGQTVTQERFRGRPMLIYFGYAYCPDVCPTALQEMGAALEILGEDASKIQAVFITIDPERDTPEVLKSYVRSNGFPEQMTGLTGTRAQIDAVAKKWLVLHQRSSEVRDAADYLMDHSSIIYLMDENGSFVAAFNHQDSPQVLAQCLRNYLDGKPCRRS
jgi:protein SCO1/2